MSKFLFNRKAKEMIKKETATEVEAAVFAGFQYTIVEDDENEKPYARIDGAENEPAKIRVPEEINGYPVKRIAARAFANEKKLEEVVLPNSIEKIGKRAFTGCTNLRTVELPKNMTALFEECFQGCTSLEEVVLPENIKRIGKRTFKDCKSLVSVCYHGKEAEPVSKKKKVTVKQEGLPGTLTEIREGAFENCQSLTYVYIPAGTSKIEKSAFRGCGSLELLTLSEGIQEILGEAFGGCGMLKKVKVPETLQDIGEDTFSQDVQLMCGKKGQFLLQAKRYENLLVVDESALNLMSGMEPARDGAVQRFYTAEDLKKASAIYELKSEEYRHSYEEEQLEAVNASRYVKDGNKYVLTTAGETEQVRDRAKLILSGALFCESAEKNTRERLKQIAQGADLTLAQTRAVIASDEQETDENAFAKMKELGTDLVVNAFPDAENCSIASVYRSLHAINRAQLMHTGLFASCNDKRYVNLEVNGMKLAVVAYSDIEELVMQTKNYTDDGRKTLFGIFDAEQAEKDIADARAEGAEFVLACVYWNKSADGKVTDRIETCAKALAEAGADFIFGCGDYGVMPYNVLHTAKQRKVPVIYSAGGVSKIEKKLYKDNLIVEVNLCRAEDGTVCIAEQGYYPFTAANTKEGVITDIGMLRTEVPAEDRMMLEEAYIRMKRIVGVNEAFECYTEADPCLKELAEGNLSPLQRKYEVNPIRIAKKKHGLQAERGEEYVLDEATGIYYRSLDQGEREARIFCTGQLNYDFLLEKNAETFGHYEFRKSFKEVAKCFADADFVYGNLSTMMSSDYPTICEVSKDVRGTGYSNCREEFLAALKDTGFTGLAVANPHNAMLGISGIMDTEAAIRKNNMISSGIGYEKNPVVDINGIKIGFLSITTDCMNKTGILTEEAAVELLNQFDAERVENDVQALKDKGAEFVLAYVHCGSDDSKLNLKGRKKVAEAIAEAGADYVICTIPRVISEYYRFTTSDQRSVPVVSSLGSFIAGKGPADGFHAAILKLFVRRTFDGSIEVEDQYIPLKVFKHHKGAANAVIPALAYLNKNVADNDDNEDAGDVPKENEYKNAERTVANKLGPAIRCSCKRLVKVADEYTRTLTIEEIYRILKKTPSQKDLQCFGDKYKEPVSCVALRKRYMKAGGVAVMYKYGNFGEVAPIKWSVQECVEAGVSLVIDNEPHDEIPCIVVEEPLMDVFGLLSKTVRDWYHPVTIGITGSMGKTTTKELMTSVFETHFKTLCAQGNSNAIYQIGQLVQQMEDDDEAYIQEVHGGTKDTASFTSKVISPDICVITNIVKNHMSQIGSIENLVKNKLGIADGLKENGVLILCHDNEYLKDVDPPVRTIRYSISDETCQYYARNIIDEGAQISFQIVSKASEFDEAGVYDAKLNIRGVHNVSNALAAFAAGRQAGIPAHRIIAGLSRYQSTGIRQNVFEHGGVKMLLDTYNSNPKALMAMMDVFEKLERGEDGRKILILGMMGEQGDDSPQIHYDTGKALCQYDFDKLFCIGKDAKYMVQAVKECGKEAYFFTERDSFNHVICANVRPGDAVLVKGSHSMELDTATMIPIFGRAIRQN